MNVIDQIRMHRSIRKYHPDPIPKEVLNEILEAGIRASSSGNMQAYSVIVSTDARIKKRLLEPHMGQNMVIDAPVLLTFCADFHRMRRWLKLSQAPENFDNMISFMIAAIDAILVSQNVALAAESKGLGICYLGSTLANSNQIGKLLDVPYNVVPVVGFTVGYPAEQPQLRDRLPAEGLIHWEKYQHQSDQAILDIYNKREVKGWERYMKTSWIRDQVDQHGIQNLAQLYTVVKYTRESYQEYSQNLMDYLKEQNFYNHTRE